MTQQYINELVRAYPSIQEVWLFGSRANGTDHPGSDWDYLVFGDDCSLLNTLCQDVHRKRAGIDLLFAGTPDLASCPWTEPNGYRKTLGLGDAPNGIGWRAKGSVAVYTESKKRYPDDPNNTAVDLRQKKAKLVYRRIFKQEN
jgi:hypothetical protein